MTEASAYLNGRIMPVSQVALPIFDAGLVLGATVSELTRTFKHVPYRLDDHLDRLFRGLDYLGIDSHLSLTGLRAVATELVEYNAPLLPAGGDLGIIHFVTPGPYATYMPTGAVSEPTVCVHTFPLPFYRWAARMREGARLVTTSVRDVPADCVDRTVKQRSRLHYYLADQEAKRRDPGALALLQNAAGHITETATANILIVKAGRLLSPPSSQILPGISRDTTLRLAGHIDLDMREAFLSVADVQAADEAFLTSTPFCLMPVTMLDGVKIGDGRPGPLYQKLLAAWSAEAGLDIAAQFAACK